MGQLCARFCILRSTPYSRPRCAALHRGGCCDARRRAPGARSERGEWRGQPTSAPFSPPPAQPGTSLVVSGYAMYGSSTELVLTFGDGVNVFTLDPSIGEFLLTRRNVRIPEKPQR